MTTFHQKHIFGFGFSGALALAIAGLTVPASAQVAIESRKNPSPLLSVQAPAAVKVEAGWVRPSVPGQQGTGGYMRLTAREGQQLVAVSSPLAGVAEVHEMKMDGEVMRMRAVGNLELPAGKTVELKPGGLHLMLMDLKQPLTVGSSVPLSLVFRDQRGVESRIETRLLVSPAAPDSAAPHEMHKH
jgi:copper(I)-binding protein